MEFHRDRCEGTFGGGNKRAYNLRQGALHIYFKAILQTVCIDHHEYLFWSSLSSL
jgi:hypothetical protein